ncbi:MAGUK p55 subfamily member 2-like isoform X2 [Polypterus senegalus]|uniref:MAGUK p55 subfamily member 2-like isoform X2 n=1 Tax=Polypterus senegalus TaxID=55291 RepID=UPI001964DE03|nr:MAGUK p55 subfamily member 2-like isoform X2 [Polypterus senegalus]
MPVASAHSDSAMQQGVDTLSDVPNSTVANDLDLIFLKEIMESPIAHEKLEETKLEAVRDNNLELVQDILVDISPLVGLNSMADELARILTEPHFQSLLETHDSVASKSYETPPPSPCAFMDPALNNQPVPPDAVRMVGIRKVSGEHLGVTFRVENNDLVIARILHGGMIDQQGLLHVGDIIKEVNGKEVGSDPKVLQEMLKDASGSVVLKILPSYQEPHPPRQVFVKCHFDYDPAHDNLIPCKEAGMTFNAGDILQIVNQEDLNWWQACHVKGGSAGLIPSQLLEEKRKAFVKRDLELAASASALCGGISGKKKKKMMYLTTKNAEFDRHELLIYEEVAKMPPFRRKSLVLIGAQGVGRRSLKNKLMLSDPSRYGTTIPYTSRKPKEDEKDGQMYSFVSRSEMERDIKNGRYLEHGEYEGNLYGTKIDSIHEVVETGKVCILDVNPQALKVLRTSEFLPYVVFIAAPEFDVLRSMNKAAIEAGVLTKQLTETELKRTVEESGRIQRAYGHYFDLTITNDNLERCFRSLQGALERLNAEPQWVPVSWVF